MANNNDDHGECKMKEEWGRLHEWMENQSRTSDKILAQVEKTNGRVNKLEKLRLIIYTTLGVVGIFVMLLFPTTPIGAMLYKMWGGG
jgi:hypothetical protein